VIARGVGRVTNSHALATGIAQIFFDNDSNLLLGPSYWRSANLPELRRNIESFYLNTKTWSEHG